MHASNDQLSPPQWIVASKIAIYRCFSPTIAINAIGAKVEAIATPSGRFFVKIDEEITVRRPVRAACGKITFAHDEVSLIRSISIYPCDPVGRTLPKQYLVLNRPTDIATTGGRV